MLEINGRRFDSNRRGKYVAAHKKPGQWNKETIIIIGLMCLVFLWTLNRVELENKPQEETMQID